jgi:hypothetical protein
MPTHPKAVATFRNSRPPTANYRNTSWQQNVSFSSLESVNCEKYSLSCTERYRGADKSLARPTSRCILFDGENISFDAGLVLYI